MPHLPQDELAIETGGALVEVVRELAGTHPGFRAAHARGIMLHGTFQPTQTARSLSTAPHFNDTQTLITARLSDPSGDPARAENDLGNKPKGLAVRFHLGSGKAATATANITTTGPSSPGARQDSPPPRADDHHTDMVTVTVDGFPASSGDDALAFFQASRDGALAGYLSAHPEAQAYLELPSPQPASFAAARFFGVNAVKLIDARGGVAFVRYRVEPAAGVRSLTEEEARGEPADYLVRGLPGLLARGPVVYRLTAQVAGDGDVTDDCTVHWPETRRVVELGTISLEGIVDDSSEEEKHIVFDPLPRGVAGLEPSGDPLLGVRSLVYRMSARERGAL